MRYLDTVKINTTKYERDNIPYGAMGIICAAPIWNNCFQVEFFNNIKEEPVSIDIDDLDLVQSSGADEDELIENLPNYNPRLWCIVEDGFIYNLLGEKKNEFAYDYRNDQ